jgi:flavin reductase (DIM6/NTAB) family NADH-FMN oxidoreductase RutF
VSVVTASDGTQRSGLVATSVTGLAAEPATLLVCVNQASSTFPLIRTAGAFAVNVLAAEQQDLAERFSGRLGHKGEDRYAGARWATLDTGAPVLADALVVLDCEVEDIIPRHSHGIVIGRIRATAGRPGHASLLYWQGGYRALLSD